MPVQLLTLTLDGITAGDYLAWVRDPEPQALGAGLCSIGVRADPLGDSIHAVLTWGVQPPSPRAAATAAGLPLTPEVIGVEAREAPARRSRRHDACSPRRRAPWTARFRAIHPGSPRATPGSWRAG